MRGSFVDLSAKRARIESVSEGSIDSVGWAGRSRHASAP